MSKNKQKIKNLENLLEANSMKIRNAGIEIKCCWCDHDLVINELVADDSEEDGFIVPIAVCDHCGAEFDVEDMGYGEFAEKVDAIAESLKLVTANEDIMEAMEERKKVSILQ